MNWRKWLDDCKMAAEGAVAATKERRFWYGFVPAFLGFGWLINMLSGGISKFQMMFIAPFPEGLKIAGENLIALFGVGQPFLDWLPVFLIAVLQGWLIGMIVLLWKKKQENAASIEKAGIVAGLIALGAGCPTCGTTLISPLLGVIFSTGGLAITGTVSAIVTCIAIIVAIFALRRLGLENYVMIKNEKYLKRHKSAGPRA